MIPLLQLIESKLLEVHPRVFQDDAPHGTKFPYIIYEQTGSGEPDERPEIITFDVEIESNNQVDPVTFELLAQAVNDKLHRLRYTDANLGVYIYRTDRGKGASSDSTIRVRSLTFEARVYFMTGG